MFIIASVGIKNFSDDKIRKIILAGADAIRYSVSHGPVEHSLERIKNGIKIIDELNSSAKVIVNLPSNQIRLASPHQPRTVVENEEILLKSVAPDCPSVPPYQDLNTNQPSTDQYIYVHLPDLGNHVYINQITTIDQGKIALQIMEIINNETIRVRALNEGIIQSTLGIHIHPQTADDTYLDRVRAVLEGLSEISPEYLAVPYINHSINEKIKQLSDFSWRPKIIARIESHIAAQNLEQICQDDFYDLILLNRGKLGLDMPFERLGIFQKEAIQTIKKYKKQAIISSQILEGTIHNYIPLRSDILDLTNIVLDGADGIMLCNETALSSRPAYTLSVAKKIIFEAEKYKKLNNL